MMSRKVEITVSFRGDPENTGAAETLFRAGETPTLEDAYADLIIGKGLAREAGERSAAPVSKAPGGIPDAPKL